MTKSDIVKRITEKTGIDKQQVIGTVELLMKVIKNSLIMGENVYLRGFGTFRIKHRAEKKARNILKNTTVMVPPHSVPVFKPAKDFIESLK